MAVPLRPNSELRFRKELLPPFTSLPAPVSYPTINLISEQERCRKCSTDWLRASRRELLVAGAMIGCEWLSMGLLPIGQSPRVLICP